MAATSFVTFDSFADASRKAKSLRWADSTVSASYMVATSLGEQEVFFDRSGQAVSIMVDGDAEDLERLGDHLLYRGVCLVCGEDEDFLRR